VRRHYDSVLLALAERLRHACGRLYLRDGVADDKVDARCAIECLDHFVFRRQISTGPQLGTKLILLAFSHKWNIIPFSNKILLPHISKQTQQSEAPSSRRAVANLLPPAQMQ